ncbi:di-heme oxidoredictase family protein [Cytophaga aurantiaca]|uniref:di-heme oxidoreductase family protein n=1 Tax=Cytophaga aurantiaca TaxID=29530 RepID=UPI00035E8390|nr:di-heme oxidoredictase family protein [Cytophaga aurantiaca]
MFKKSSLILSVILFVSVTTMQFCHHNNDAPAPSNSGTAEVDEEYSGGTTTIFDATMNAFGFPAQNLSQFEKNKFSLGNSVFKANWVVAPASTTSLDGLGPLFNSRSCSGCHTLDGRATPPVNAGDDLGGLLFRLSIPGDDGHGGPLGDPQYGGQLSNHGIYAGASMTAVAEGTVDVTYSMITGTYNDGTSYELRDPHYTFRDLGYGPFSTGIMYSPRLAQQIPGLGLLEAISEADILALADPSDANDDGISGRPNYVWNYKTSTTDIGRFGWKANQPTLLQQTAGAAMGDMGLSTTLFPDQNLTGQQVTDYGAWTTGGTPEMQVNDFDQLVFYCQTLAVPARRNWEDAEVLRGKVLFTQAKCASCHTPYFQTGTHPITALSNQKIRPYTDLLLHDMGAGLADGRPDYLATGTEWRTPPLWGIGLIQTVNNGGRFLMHDGRARSVAEAILWHGGEAQFSQKAFIKMNAADRAALLKFVNSL